MITAVILTKDEEKNIRTCIESLDFVNEIILVDDKSKDKTVSIAESYGAKVFVRKLAEDFSIQRNYGLEQAKGEWVLFVDADEVVTKALKEEILGKLAKPSKVTGYYFKRRDFIWGKELMFGETANNLFLRLARKGFGTWHRKVHETWDIRGWKNNFKNPIFHYPHQTLSEFVYGVNYFSSLHADANRKEKKRSSVFKIIFWPKLKFFQNYILRLGFFDSSQGFIISMIMSFHSFLAWSKLWVKQSRN